jgi:hypothetical protein
VHTWIIYREVTVIPFSWCRNWVFGFGYRNHPRLSSGLISCFTPLYELHSICMYGCVFSAHPKPLQYFSVLPNTLPFPWSTLSPAPCQRGVTMKKRSHDQCYAGISFTWMYPPGTNEAYYLSYLIFSKSICLNSMHIQKHINLKKYTCFATLDMFSNSGKLFRINVTQTLKSKLKS